jgi:hypothetical protein
VLVYFFNPWEVRVSAPRGEGYGICIQPVQAPVGRLSLNSQWPILLLYSGLGSTNIGLTEFHQIYSVKFGSH